MILKNAKTLGTVHTHTHTHTLCSLKDKSLKKLGLISVAQKLYLKYKEIKVDM